MSGIAVCEWCDNSGVTAVALPCAVPMADGQFACTCHAGAAARQRATAAQCGRALANAQMPVKFAEWTLDTWKASAHKSIEHVRAHTAVRMWLQDAKRAPWLMIRGDTGRGKTGLMCGALKQLAEAGHTTRFVCVMDMIDEMKARFAGDLGSYVQALANVEVLGLDELVPPFMTDWRVGVLFELIYRRDMAQRVTMFTTCATNEEIAKALTVAGARRVVENSLLVTLTGKELRHISR